MLRKDSREKESYAVLLAVVTEEVAAEVGLPEELFLNRPQLRWEFGLRVVMLLGFELSVVPTYCCMLSDEQVGSPFAAADFSLCWFSLKTGKSPVGYQCC